MRILFDSKKTEYKAPFGCLTPGQLCRLHIRIPESVKTTSVTVVMTQENGAAFKEVPMSYLRREDLYDVWTGELCIEAPGLYFYYFRVTGHTGTFRLFKYGDDTNMEDGACWQVSCIPEDFVTPAWAKGAVFYQIFPDRFYKAGDCDLTGKLKPYTVHGDWNEEVHWQPNERGEILNNDFFGGNFRGIVEKMEHIASLGTTVLYLNPIGKAFSNHRYDTADYKTPDPILGTMEDFRQLCKAAHRWGIRVILDGVYSHTGADSLYFNRYGTFGTGGAYQDPNSPYVSWYDFEKYPDRYKSWWGFETLPTVNKLDKAFTDYIFDADDSVIAHWLNAGADGFRLDVADELPGEFLFRLKKRLRKIRPDALLLGEVWEDASNKISYHKRCRYFVDGVLDSVMNYPFRKAILDFMSGADDGRKFRDTVMTVLENYPKQVVLCNMNLLGTHDTPRILSALAGQEDAPRYELAQRKLSRAEYDMAVRKLMIATVLQYVLPGCPSIYYADEVGAEGGKDPFNRRTYPWGREDLQLLSHYKALGQLRKEHLALQTGDTEILFAEGGRIVLARIGETETVKCYVNLSGADWEIPAGNSLFAGNLQDSTLAPMGWCIQEA